MTGTNDTTKGRIQVEDGKVTIWCQHSFAIKSYDLIAQGDDRPLVRDLDASAVVDGYDNLSELMDLLGDEVWLWLEDFCSDFISGDSFANAVPLVEVFIALGVDVSELAGDPERGCHPEPEQEEDPSNDD